MFKPNWNETSYLLTLTDMLQRVRYEISTLNFKAQGYERFKFENLTIENGEISNSLVADGESVASIT